MIKKMGKMRIASRLAASFALVIIIFIAGLTHAFYAINNVNRRHRQNLDFVVAKNEYMLNINQGLLTYQQFISSTFTNTDWRMAANAQMWLEHEKMLRAYRDNIGEFAESYIQLIIYDPWRDSENYHEQIALMLEILFHIDAAYAMLSKEIFLSDLGIDDSAIAFHASTVDNLLFDMRLLAYAGNDYALARIDAMIERESLLAALIVILVSFLSVAIVYLMIKSFKNNIKDTKNQLVLVENGDFDTVLENAKTNEISEMFVDLINVFSHLISEINEVSGEAKNYNTDARINVSAFKGSYSQST